MYFYEERRRQNSRVRGALLGVIVWLVVPVAAAGVGFWYGRAYTLSDGLLPQVLTWLDTIFDTEPEKPGIASREFQARIAAVAERIDEMEAELRRSSALGRRVVLLAGLDPAEFDFDRSASVSGSADAWLAGEMGLLELVTLSDFIAEHKRSLLRLDRLVKKKAPGKRTVLSVWPVRSGYVSSGFGRRIHPILKKSHFHSGIDFAGKMGAPIFAAADGVVIYSGWRSGYGRTVEIRHQDSLVTRYAHNQKNLVKQGERVAKGQKIAKLGSSGRSTGPHVHFEVRRDGKAVDPLDYIAVSMSYAGIGSRRGRGG